MASEVWKDFWKLQGNNRIHSAISCLQILSDTFHVSMSANVSIVYPLHVTFHHCTKELRGKYSSCDSTVCVYLTVSFEAVAKRSYNFSAQSSSRNVEKIPVMRVTLLQVLHDSIEFILESLAELAFIALNSKNSDVKNFLHHLMISSLITHIPQCEDILSVKLAIKLTYPCHNF